MPLALPHTLFRPPGRSASTLLARLVLAAGLLTGLAALTVAHAGQAQWFTLTGEEGDARSDYIQVDLGSVSGKGAVRTISVRVSRSTTRTSREGIVFRSFEAPTEVNCVNKTARFMSSAFYDKPNFEGTPFRTVVFAAGDIRPMAFREISGKPTERTIRAACGTDEVKTTTE